jgi:hypothetical protein
VLSDMTNRAWEGEAVALRTDGATNALSS